MIGLDDGRVICYQITKKHEFKEIVVYYAHDSRVMGVALNSKSSLFYSVGSDGALATAEAGYYTQPESPSLIRNKSKCLPFD